MLGTDHDLNLLSQVIAEMQPKREIRKLVQMIKHRRKRLGRLAAGLGGPVFAEPANIFCSNLHRAWQSWRVGH